MNTDDNLVTIPSDANPITIRTTLSDFHSDISAKAEATEADLRSSFADVETKLEKTDDAISERARITNKYELAVAKKFEELTEAKERRQVSLDKGRTLQSSREDILRGYRDVKKNLNVASGKLTEIRSIGDNFDAIASVLATVTCFIDKTRPILWTPRKFSWVTIHIFMRDADTTVLPVDFGRFEVSLYVYDGRLSARMIPLEPNPRGSYPHPHVNSDETPCLGNAGAMLLQCLRQGDIGTAVSVTHEFLTSYNPASPYLELDKWIDCRYYSPLCECGLMLANKCGCTRCLCGANLEVDYRATSECGFCGECCNQHHNTTERIRELRVGINGSSCLNSATPVPLEPIVPQPEPDTSSEATAASLLPYVGESEEIL